MEAKTVELKNIGTILIERSLRARHMNLSVRPFKGVRVALPLGVTFASAEKFARAKAGWIKKQQEKMAVMEQEARMLLKKPIDRRAASDRLIERLNQLARLHGFIYNRAFIKNQKTRWGSCSGKNNINLNISLARLPDDLIDYTLIHELVHTRIKHHGRQFWSKMDELVGDAKKLDKRLNRYAVLLI